MTIRQLRLLAWAKAAHEKAKTTRKDNEPYYLHVLRVGQMAQKYEITNGLEIGFCHDLIEDCNIGVLDIFNKCLDLGYSHSKARYISSGVSYLTDVFTPEDFPDHNRTLRKKMEAERLGKIPDSFQTIKYCDLLDNTPSIVRIQPDFAVTYLKEKYYCLQQMTSGNQELRKKAIDSVIMGCFELLDRKIKKYGPYKN